MILCVVHVLQNMIGHKCLRLNCAGCDCFVNRRPMQLTRILRKMYNRMRDHDRHLALRRKSCWEMASIIIMKRHPRSRDKILLKAAAEWLHYRSKEWKLYLQRVHNINTSSWMDVIYGMSDFEFLASFCVTEADFNAVVRTIAWLTTKTVTSKNKYGT